MMFKNTVILVSLCTLLLSTACSSTKMQDVWQAEDFSKKEIQNILVIGVTAHVTNRMVFEREFAYQLKKRGIKATPSYKVIGKKTPEKEHVKEFLKTSDFDYVLLTYVGSKEVDKTFIKPTVTNYATGGYPYAGYGRYGYGYPTMGGYWDANITTIQTPGYFDETTKTILITSIYDVHSEDIRWTGRSSTFEAQSVSLVTEEVAEVVWDHIDQ